MTMKRFTLPHSAITISFLTVYISYAFTNKLHNNRENLRTNKNTIVATYLLDYKPDSLSETRRNELTRLIVSNARSRFESVNSHKRDSVTKEFEHLSPDKLGQNYINSLTSIPLTNFNFIIIKKNSLTYHYDKLMFSRKLYFIENAPNKQNWQIKPDTKKIAGYSCQKASCLFAGRKYNAWFTKEIPVSDGPYKFQGLPGLILEVRDEENHYSFVIRKIAWLQEEMVVEEPKVFIPTNVSDFAKASSNYKAAVPMRLASTAKNPEDKAQIIKSAESKLNNLNNSIEIMH